MNLRQFEFVLALAKTKSFRKASELLYLSQPAISKQISALEDELGLELFKRSYGDVSLSPEGEIILKAISQCRSIFDDAVDEARMLKKTRIRYIRLGISELSEFPGFSEAVASFHLKHSDIIINVERARIEDLNFSESEREYDIIITHEIGIRKERGIQTRKLRPIHQSALVSRKNQISQKKGITFCDLKDQRFLIPSSTLQTISKDYCIEICELGGFRPQEIVPMHNIDSVITAVEMNLGVAVFDEKVPDRPLNDIIRVPSPYFSHFIMAWKNNNDPILNGLADEIAEHCTH